jgi:signal transduction histidine kinase
MNEVKVAAGSPSGDPSARRQRRDDVRGPLGLIVGVPLLDATAETHVDPSHPPRIVPIAESSGDAERRAREEAALRRAIASVVTSTTIRETIDRIAQGALVATDANGAFVERIDATGRSLEVVSTAGVDTAAPGTTTPYAGSFVESALRSGEAVFISRLQSASRSMPGDVVLRYAKHAGLVLPLIGAGELIGSLTLLRSADRAAFRDDEVERARAFSDIASLSFRRIRILEDVTRRHEENKRITESRARLVRGFSHDVKNPLNAADGFLQILEMHVRGSLTAAQSADVARARRLLSSAVRLIDELLDLARADAGQIDVRSAPTDVWRLVHDIANDFRAQANAKNLELTLAARPEMELVSTDPSRVRQILANLLSNAIKYTQSGTVSVEVSIVPEGGAFRPGPS